jgi:beta-N-acetylhexosaminidase
MDPIAITCGQLIVAGFDGASLPAHLAAQLSRRERAGVILFKRNLDPDFFAIAELNRAIASAAALPSSGDAPPLIAVDQEGGRVARLGPPALVVPPMRVLAAHDDEARAERVARAQARELAALGFTMNFAPVLDVDSCAENPIIGDRSFARDAATVARFGVAYARGLEAGGILACGKHFPGHGDTRTDSHLELPHVDAPRARLDDIELPPFAAAARAKIAAFMSAHVVYPALDADRPATMSFAICTTLLRDTMKFEGVLFSDDLEMNAISAHHAVEDAAVLSIAAGCDILLVCSDEAMQARVYDALVREAEKSEAFRSRCQTAAERSRAMRRRVLPVPARTRAELLAVLGGAESRAAAADLSS